MIIYLVLGVLVFIGTVAIVVLFALWLSMYMSIPFSEWKEKQKERDKDGYDD